MQEMQETQVWSLCRENPLKESRAIHASTLAWRISWTEETGGLHVQRVTKSRTQLKWLSMHSINRGYSDLKYLCVCVCVCVCVHARTHSVTQSCPILSNLMGRSPLGSSVHGILQERIVERVAIPFSRVSSRPQDLHCRKILNHLSHQGSPLKYLYYFLFIGWQGMK